jgi:hypothetical protein
MHIEDRYPDNPSQRVFVDNLQPGDTIPSHDGYVHTVKHVSYDGDDTITVEFWKGPHYTYTCHYGAADTILIEL